MVLLSNSEALFGTLRQYLNDEVRSNILLWKIYYPLLQGSNDVGTCMVYGPNSRRPAYKTLLQMTYPILFEVDFDSVILADGSRSEIESVIEVAKNGYSMTFCLMRKNSFLFSFRHLLISPEYLRDSLAVLISLGLNFEDLEADSPAHNPEFSSDFNYHIHQIIPSFPVGKIISQKILSLKICHIQMEGPRIVTI